ncbi:alpha/beta hydrolase [Staphylococcus kloosii]|jgi:alpha-beta hydrolase superfamily lysophospholipase|uniref:Alpha/beta hydrolase n=1 Tax=Staphylococcus kloosii TaxID=29384 RepID=A0A151A5A6_9STAP|nr:alpha/beta hydrolase [Staphylococcus kloosii]AVQ36322.1 alpha/beta hydrolase [Staphylococcus kloosii]KYH14621.1 lysophospholipase [Staphylococcus kloosii]MBF7029192.1 alpha/beta hydrolase [Staphylococcus kloosii]PNZ06410.1 alpha/beta hydrolase [Staphylococcus kloosii]PTJ78715.1 alpha/beta hydrolase [Staphylococcus kloosii]
MGQNNLKITVADGATLEVKLNKAKKSTIGVVHIFHGMAEHMGRYDELVAALNQQGYDVIRHNHRGHNEEELEKNIGHIDDFDQVAEDAFEIAQTLCANYKDLPYIVIGHSMGSIIARVFAQKYPQSINGLILTGTGYYPKIVGYTLQVALKCITLICGKRKRLNWVNNLMYKSLNKRIEHLKTKSDWLSSDDAQVQAFIKDKRTGFLVSNQLIYQTVKYIVKTSKHKFITQMNPNMPILMISGKEDPLGNYGKGIHKLGKLFKRGNVKHITVHLYKNKRHEILLEKEHDTIWHHMFEWIDKQILRAQRIQKSE